jgi:2,5-diamino-6-(ribosylamino)-4(3H)-pyrimidinone 5'-phosphate reductase
MRADLGVRRLAVEGGPTLNAALLRIGAIDEFFVTLGGRVVGGRDTLTIVEGDRFAAEALPQFEPVSVIHNPAEREFYFRWRRL